MFTDIEGSTRRWEARTECGPRSAHDEVLRGAIEGHGGWLFKHTGDGVCAAFASPTSAVDAAIAGQRKLDLPVVLRALDASPGNLRAATTSLIGREAEVAELQAAVKAHRLVTLTGGNGVGNGKFGGRASVTAREVADEPWIASPSSTAEPLLGVWPGLPGRP